MSNAAQPKPRDPRRLDAHDSAGNVVPIRIGEDGDPLASFRPEGEEPPASPPPVPAAAVPPPVVSKAPALSAPNIKPIVWATAAAVVVVGVAGVAGWRAWTATVTAKATPPVGAVMFTSRPSGAMVLVDGVSRGATPVELQLAAGSHDVVLRSGPTERSVHVTVERGTRLVEDLDLPVAEVATAQIEITSEPAGAKVAVDGKPAGQTPLKVRDLETGRHSVVVGSGASAVT